MGPLIFTKNLGMGFRLWLNPVKRPIEFLLIGMPILAIQLAWMFLLLALDLALIVVKLAWAITLMIWGIITAVFGFRKEETA